MVSCSKESINNSETGIQGEVSLSIDKTNMPSSVQTITVSLSREGYDTIVESRGVDDQTILQIVVNNLDVGIWKVDVEALNGGGDVIYSGSANVEVTEDNTTVVNMELNSGTSGTGNILLVVSWPFQTNLIDYANNPILTRSGDSMDRYGVYESSLLKDEDGYHMWYTGYHGNDIAYIFYAHSDDGLAWERPVNTPVIYPGGDDSWDDQAITAGPVIKANGMYLMYYSGRISRLGLWHVGLATSQDGLVWEKYNNPVLLGEEGDWDYRVSASAVEKVGDQYFMYYTGISENGDYNIGLAMSDDGLSWTKHSGNPVLSATLSWEGSGVYWPAVYKNGDKYKMIYMNKFGPVSGFGEAVSNDGINWAKNYNEPVFTSSNTTNNWDQILYPSVLVEDNKLNLYYSGYISSLNEKYICYASADLD